MSNLEFLEIKKLLGKLNWLPKYYEDKSTDVRWCVVLNR